MELHEACWLCCDLNMHEHRVGFLGSAALRVQSHWMHSLPKRAGVPAPRVNLTFRTIVNPETS